MLAPRTLRDPPIPLHPKAMITGAVLGERTPHLTAPVLEVALHLICRLHLGQEVQATSASKAHMPRPDMFRLNGPSDSPSGGINSTKLSLQPGIPSVPAPFFKGLEAFLSCQCLGGVGSKCLIFTIVLFLCFYLPWLLRVVGSKCSVFVI